MSETVTLAVWLHLLREGGRWSSAELRQSMSAYKESTIHMTAIRLASGGFIKRFEKQKFGDRVRFGITRDCKVPHGVPLADLIAIGVLKEPPQ